MTAIEREYQVILDRRADRQEGSYTCYLFDQGIDKILKKVGEECTEMVIAAKNNGYSGGAGQARRKSRQSEKIPSGG